jgi:hypothetical protein
MTAQSTEDVSIWITTGDPSKDTVTSATKASPSVVTVQAATESYEDGDLVYIYETESDNLNAAWATGNGSGTSFTALSSSTVNDTVTITTGSVDHYKQSDLTKLCLSAININGTEPNTISVATFCSPTATINSQVQEAGTVSMEGYVDVTSPDYPALYDAWQVGDERLLRVDLGPDQGWLVARGRVSSVNWQVPIDGAIAYTFTMTLTEAFKHCF